MSDLTQANEEFLAEFERMLKLKKSQKLERENKVETKILKREDTLIIEEDE